MKKTYITRMPDKAGAFLKASKIISKLGGNIVRVNYNKALDLHTLFVEVSASTAAHKKIQKELEKCNYLFDETENQKIIMIVLKLEDNPGTVTPILEILKKYKVNISYISSQENGTEYQYFKMGLLIENTKEIKNLIEEISKSCEISILDYEVTDRLLDGTVFYVSFANEMRKILNLNQNQTNEVLVTANTLMQLLDEQKKSPQKTFDYIRRFAKFVVDKKGENFKCNISSYDFDLPSAENPPKMYVLEPPCGSNTYVFQFDDELLFVDSGFSCYKSEMEKILGELFPKYQTMKKTGFITHADVDHLGLLNTFHKNYMTKNCYENFALEKQGKKNFREQIGNHQPYCALSKVIANYEIPELEKCFPVENGESENGTVFAKLNKKLFDFRGTVSLGNYDFQFFEGKGGHVKGECLIVCEALKIVFTGDIFVNIKGFSPEQKEFNILAPFLMTGVDVDSKIAKEARENVLEVFNDYTICPGHGSLVEKIKK